MIFLKNGKTLIMLIKAKTQNSGGSVPFVGLPSAFDCASLKDWKTVAFRLGSKKQAAGSRIALVFLPSNVGFYSGIFGSDR